MAAAAMSPIGTTTGVKQAGRTTGNEMSANQDANHMFIRRRSRREF